MVLQLSRTSRFLNIVSSTVKVAQVTVVAGQSSVVEGVVVVEMGVVVVDELVNLNVVVLGMVEGGSEEVGRHAGRVKKDVEQSTLSCLLPLRLINVTVSQEMEDPRQGSGVSVNDGMGSVEVGRHSSSV